MWLTKHLLNKNLVKAHQLGLQPYTGVLSTMKSVVEKKKKKILKKDGVVTKKVGIDTNQQDKKAEFNNNQEVIKNGISTTQQDREAGNKGQHDRILLCQHHPVYTVGIRTKDYIDQTEKARLMQLGAEFIYTDRGGLITFHGPGQLVCYPILNLKQYNLSLRCYIHKLEEVIMQTCHKFGVATHRTDDVGIWVGDNKIAAIGVHCQRHVTSHGLALNCNTDLSWFSHIVPCGLEGKSVTSLTREVFGVGSGGEEYTVDTVTPYLVDSFAEVFDCDIEIDADIPGI